MAQFRTSRTFDVIFLITLAGLLLLASTNRVSIGDWVYFISYQPSAETIQVANDAGLSPFGRHLLYRSNPEFASLATVTKVCDIERIGCLTSSGHAIILDLPGEHSQTVVTSAHEMLHLAYRRLSQAQKDKLAPLIDQAIQLNNRAGIANELKDQTNIDDRRDEAHSLLGTEYNDLPPALEQYYSQYFLNRSKVLADEAVSEKQ